MVITGTGITVVITIVLLTTAPRLSGRVAGIIVTITIPTMHTVRIIMDLSFIRLDFLCRL